MGGVCGNFCDDSSIAAVAGQTVVGVIPVVGQVADVRDTLQAIGDVILNHDRDSVINLGTTAAAWIPGFDVLKGGGRPARRALREEEREVAQKAPLPDEPNGRSEKAPDDDASVPVTAADQAAEDAARRQDREAVELREFESMRRGRYEVHNEEDLRRLEANPPRADAPPPGAEPTIWTAYIDYWNKRVGDLRNAYQGGQKSTQAGPLTWLDYSAFQSRFARGRVFQDSVTRQLREAHRELDIRSDVGISRPGSFRTLFPDQVAVDREAQRAWELNGRPPGEVPKVQTFSNKSRDFRNMSAERVQAQVEEDLTEAKNKYSGELEIRRDSQSVSGPSSENGGSTIQLKLPPHPLYGTKVQVSKVTLIYDSDLMTAAQMASIQRSAPDGVSIEFRSGSEPPDPDSVWR